MKPARAEQRAPTRNETATNGDEFSLSALTASRIATVIINTLKTLYSDLKNAIAPS